MQQQGCFFIFLFSFAKMVSQKSKPRFAGSKGWYCCVTFFIKTWSFLDCVTENHPSLHSSNAFQKRIIVFINDARDLFKSPKH